MTKAVFLLIFLVSGFIRNIEVDAYETACPEGWMHPFHDTNHGTCYHLSTEVGTFTEGLKYCKVRGGDYASIKDATTWNFLTGYTVGNYWIGLTDAEVDGEFKWNKDGTTATFTNWSSYKPENSGDVDFIAALADINYRWKTTVSSQMYKFICEMDAVKVTPGVALKCPSGFVDFQNSCYHISTAKGDWAAGKSYCRNLAGDYAKITSEEENAFLVSKLTINTWHGLNDLAKQKEYRWASDDSQATFSKWGNSEPDNNEENENCVHFKESFLFNWNDASCIKKFRFACEASMVLDGSVQLKCPSGWTLASDKCYIKTQDVTSNWDEARKECKQMGGDLASINDEEDNKAIAGIGENFVFNIGLNDLQNKGTYVWISDGSRPLYTNWGPNEPNDIGGTKDCTEVSGDSGTWNVKPCTPGARRSACEKKPNRVLAPSSACPEGWKLLRDSCYHFSTEEGTFTQGLKYCRVRGGEYANIRDAVTWKSIKRYLDGDCWLGLNDAQVDGTFKWVKEGSKPTFSNWNSNEPGNSANVDCTVAMATTGYKWKTSVSSAKFKYLCQMDVVRVTREKTLKCPSGFGEFQNSCYHISTTKGTWVEGQSYCRNKGGDYAKISNEEENAHIINQLPGDTWLGLNDLAEENKYRWASDDSEATFSKWNNGEPNNNQGKESCVHFRSDQLFNWNDATCNDKFRFACEASMVLDGSFQLKCPSGWTLASDKCYIKTQDVTSNWDEARKECKQMGGDLASIRDQDDKMALIGIGGNFDFNIGLNDRQNKGTYVWINDGSRPLYTNWGPNEPNDNGGIKDCAAVSGDSGTWNVKPCTPGARRSACERKPEKVLV